MKPTARAGFSLMEVLMATSILLASVIVLGELAGIGRRHASASRELATAQILCENKLNEILSGAAPAVRVDGEPLDVQPGWMYSVEIEPLDAEQAAIAPGMVALKVTVEAEDTPRRRSEIDHQGTKQFSLVRWIREPARLSNGRSAAATEALRTLREPVAERIR